MKLSIRMKIFLPMMTILIIFTLAVLAVFRYSLEGHMVYNARRDLEHTMRVTEDILADAEALSAAGSEGGKRNAAVTESPEEIEEDAGSLEERLENAVSLLLL